MACWFGLFFLSQRARVQSPFMLFLHNFFYSVEMSLHNLRLEPDFTFQLWLSKYWLSPCIETFLPIK